MTAKIRHLNIEVTKRCNQRCFYCFNDSGHGSPTSEFTAEEWIGILRKLMTRGLESMHLTGGEPFAYKHAVDLLAGAQSFGLSTSILSNGFRVKELVGAFPEVFSKLAVSQISLDSMNEKMHNQRRGYAWAWQDAVSAIRSLRAVNVPVEVSCVVSETNLGDLQSMAAFCCEMDAALLIRPILATGRAATQRISDSFASDLELCVKSLNENFGVPLVTDRFHYVTGESAEAPTHSPEDIHTVHYDGYMRLCNGHEVNLHALAA